MNVKRILMGAGKTEYLLDNGMVATQEPIDGYHQWKLWELDPDQSIIDIDWTGQVIFERTLVPEFTAEHFITKYERHVKSTVTIELFADIGDQVIDELNNAHMHIEAGDLDGALQHLVQFASWAIGEFAHSQLARDLWHDYGPSRINKHKDLTYGPYGWEVWNPTAYCDNCQRPMEDCHCGVKIPF